MDLIDDLTNYYKLDEASGSIIDAHGSDDGTYNGALYNQTPKLGTGSLGFITNDYVDFNTALLPTGTNADFSISAWIKLDSGSGDHTVLSQYSGGDGRFILRVQSGKLNLFIGGTGGTNITSSSTMSTDTFYHIAVTRESGVVKLYINNTEEASDTGVTIGLENVDTFVGVIPTAIQYFNGDIDELAIFNASIGSTGVSALYNSGNGFAYPFDLTTNLLSYYKLDESSGNPADSHGSNTLTNNGATANVAGKINTAYDFDGSSDDCTSTSNVGITGNASRTLNVWANADISGDADTIISIGANGAGTYTSIVQGLGGDGYYGVRESSSGLSSTTSSATDIGSWVMLTVTHDGTTLKLYRNAVLIASGAKTLGTTDGKLILGNSPEYTREFNGQLDEAGIWDRALTISEIEELYNSGDGFAYPFTGATGTTVTPDTQSLSLSQPTPTIDVTSSITVTPSVQSLTLSQPNPTIASTLGRDDESTIYVKNGFAWTEVENYEDFSINMVQNQVSEFTIKISDIEDTEKAYIKEFAEVLFLYGSDLILKGRIQKISYGTAYECNVTGYGMEAILLDKEFTKSGDKRVQYTNDSAQTIAKELLSSNSDGSSPWIMESDGLGLFDTDYGNISMRYEYANRLSALAKLTESMNYEWGISQSADFDTDYFQSSPLLPTTTRATVSQGTFAIAGADPNCSQTSNERDITNVSNKIDGLGYGDGVNQIKTSTYNASATFTTLGSSISSTDTTITLTDASAFASSGTIRIMEEIITYSGKTSNNLTGCTRGTSSTDALEHKAGVFVEKYVVIASAESGSSINDNGLMDDTIINRDILDVATLELVISRELLKKLDPIVRIKIIPDEPEETVAKYKIGDLVTIDDDESDIDDDYRIVSIKFESSYGDLGIELGCSNKTLTFIEQMAKERKETEALGKYMQGSTNIYAINEAENCDSTHPLDLRFWVPNEAIAINHVLLNFKLKDYRAYSTGVTGAPQSQTNSSVWAASNAANWNFGWDSVENFSDDIARDLGTTSDVLSTTALYETSDDTFYLPTTQVYDRWVNTTDASPDEWSDLSSTWGFIYTAYEQISSKKIPLANVWYQDTVVDDWSEIDHVMSVDYTEISKSGWVSETANPTFDIPVVSADLTGTFDKIRVSFSYYHGTLTNRTISFYLERSETGASWSTVDSWTSESVNAGDTFHGTVEESTDYMGYFYRVRIANSYVNDSVNLSTCIINVETFMKTASDIDYGIEEETLVDPSVIVKVGEDGDTLTTIDTYTTDQIEVDITNEVAAVGAGKWVNIEFDANQNMRIEANAYIQIFIESK